MLTLNSHKQLAPILRDFQAAPAVTQAKTWLQRVSVRPHDQNDQQTSYEKNTKQLIAFIENSEFSDKSKVNVFNKSQYQTKSEVLLNPVHHKSTKHD